MTGHSQLRKGRCSIPNQIYHVSTATSEWRPVFRNFQFGRIVVSCMRYQHDAGHVDSLAFVVMPDHIHWLFSLTDSRSLGACVGSVKSFSARKINDIRGTDSAIWQSAFYDRAIRREDGVEAVARYIVANPLRAGIVDSVKEYALWDAKWL